MWLLFGSALAATITINPGDDWCGAINGAAAGDEIELVGGEHAGPCTIRTDDVTLIGDGALPWIAYDGANSNVIDIEASGVTISGVKLGPTQPNIDAIKIKSGDDTHITGCWFDRVGGISIAANSATSTGTRIVGNHFTDLQATGIYLGCHDGTCRAADFVISGNLIDGVVSSGVGYGMETKLNSWGVISDNVVNNTQGPAIEVYGSEGTTDWTVVEGNYTVGSTNDATIEIGGGPAIVRNNIVIGGNGGGIYAYDYGGRGLQREVQILGNSVIGMAGPAIGVASWAADRGLVLANNAAWQETGYGPALPAPIGGVDMVTNVACDADCWTDAANGDWNPMSLTAGTGGYDMTDDFCGVERYDPPIIGAIERDGPTSLPIDFKDTFGCSDGTGGTDTPSGDDDDDDVSGDDDDDGASASDEANEGGGCRCATGDSSGWIFLIGLLAAASSSRRR